MSLPEADEDLVLLHNPRCSKSRTAKALLEESGVTFVTRNYLENPLNVHELRDLAKRLDSEPSNWVRKGESVFGRFFLNENSSVGNWIEAIVEEPILLERPILIAGLRAVVARPPEKVLDLVVRAGLTR